MEGQLAEGAGVPADARELDGEEEVEIVVELDAETGPDTEAEPETEVTLEAEAELDTEMALDTEAELDFDSEAEAAVTGQIVVEIATTEVTTTVECAGQFWTVVAQFVI
ncbi:hypothetical protein LTR04_003412, partial [Oleoguttula sp. CCFEE 6159]